MKRLLEVVGLSKRFGRTVANDGVTFDVRAGELHCLFGENGAGKSTLSAMLTGLLQPDDGALVFDGHEVAFASPLDALGLGIGICRQHFSLVERFTVLENVMLGTDRHRFRRDTAAARARLDRLVAALDLPIRADERVEDLSVGERQWVEILKALFVDVRLLILDEPTAVLTPMEAERLFRIIDRLRADGLTVLLVSHKLAEVMAADRVTVLRRGRVVATLEGARTTAAELTGLMMGGTPPAATRRSPRRLGRPVLEIDGLVAGRGTGANRLDLAGTRLELCEGEILGLAGVAGNGQGDLFDTLVGTLAARAGAIRIDGRDVAALSPRARMALGVGYIPEDRFGEGLVGEASIAENLAIGHHRSSGAGWGPFLSSKRMDATAREVIARFDIRQAVPSTPVGRLSGGNAQKVVAAREIARAHRLLLANQPTRGLDVGAAAFLFDRIAEAAANGAAVLVACEEIDDLIRLSDRIAVLFKGRIVGIVEASAVTPTSLGLMMAGGGEVAA